VIAKPTFLVKSSCVLPVVKTSVKVISYKPRLMKEAWLVLPSKDIFNAIAIKRYKKMWQAKANAFAKTQEDYEVVFL
jgi:hypothetical protein